MKPKHFRKIKYPTSCENCRHAERDWDKRVTNCTKHNFVIVGSMHSKALDKTTCDDASAHPEES